MQVPITRPVIGDEEAAAVAEVLASGYLVQGPRVAEFERLVAELVGCTHAVAVSNCTAALRISLLALGIGPGDRVIVTPYSWVATANVIELCGATPVFLDVDIDTFNLSPELLGEFLADASKSAGIAAIMPVHTFGNPAGIDDVMSTAERFGIPVVEDAACALGTTIGGRAAGSLGAVSCFSFHPRKIVTTGEGGMVVTDRDDIADFARSFRNHGQRVIDGVNQFVMPGDNIRLTEMQGAIGVVQMGRLAELVTARGELSNRYDDAVRALGCAPQHRSPGAAVQSYVCLTPTGTSATGVITSLRAQGVEATIGTNAIPFTAYYHDRYAMSDDDLPATAALRDRAITLPLFPGMSTEQQDTVIAALAEALA